jgi:methyl-accepting chemotaxis protein
MATDVMVQSANRRRRYFIDKAFQGKYVAMMAVFIVSLGIAGLLILVLGSGYASGQETPNLRGAIVAMLGVMFVFICLTIWFGVRFSHRVVGPVYAIGRHLGWVLDGNYTRDLVLRDKDEFRGIEAIFNKMQAALRERARNEAAALARVESSLEELTQVLGAGDCDHEAARELILRLHQDIESIRVHCEGCIEP